MSNLGHWVLYNITRYNYVVVHENSGIKVYLNIGDWESILNGAREGTEVSFSLSRYLSTKTYFGRHLILKSPATFRPVHLHIDRQSFIWVNLDKNKSPTFPWKDDFDGVDAQFRHSLWHRAEDYIYDHTWEIEANRNWKLAADNRNECYHCKTTHPGIPAMISISPHNVEPAELGCSITRRHQRLKG